MRIAHVTDVYLPRLGGIELQVHDLALRQRSAGHETVVLTTTAPQGGVTGGPADVDVLRLGRGRIGAGPYRGVRDDELAATLVALGVDAVHAHLSVFSPLAWAAARLSSHSGLPTVVSVHSLWHDLAPLVRTYSSWQRASAWPVAWAAVSGAAAAGVRDALDGPPVDVLPNGIDPGAWLLPGVPDPTRVPTLISVGRMVRRKRPRQLLSTLLALRARHPGRFRAVLVGDGPLLPALRREVETTGAADDITLTGALDRTAIRARLATADLYLAPAQRESFGIAALEARSAGLPVIARAGSGVADFIRDGVDGWLVGSEAELFSTVSGLLDAPDRIAEVGRHNRAVPPAVNWDTVLNQASALYERAATYQGRVGVR